MARTGRPRIPTALRLLNGNRSRRPINDEEPEPERVSPSCPRHIQGEERKEWRRVTKEMLAMKVLSRADRAALEGYCAMYAKWRLAKDEMAKPASSMIYKTESGYPIISPWWNIMTKAYEEMVKFWQEFGLTAASRTRIRIEKPKPIDAFDAFKQKKKTTI